ncbi:hypothetical protein BP5796_02165 [Coleophoma crateriformis]|uniref:Uncharacterized protein n=1 Tax=Coleophoma crateriformis TaxID=565419 RepID=A0A3D8SXK5_9HELO|nr:hypothetical protein BP5796_02165 [Coleophoma crateriformis]
MGQAHSNSRGADYNTTEEILDEFMGDNSHLRSKAQVHSSSSNRALLDSAKITYTETHSLELKTIASLYTIDKRATSRSQIKSPNRAAESSLLRERSNQTATGVKENMESHTTSPTSTQLAETTADYASLAQQALKLLELSQDDMAHDPTLEQTEPTPVNTHDQDVITDFTSALDRGTPTTIIDFHNIDQTGTSSLSTMYRAPPDLPSWYEVLRSSAITRGDLNRHFPWNTPNTITQAFTDADVNVELHSRMPWGGSKVTNWLPRGKEGDVNTKKCQPCARRKDGSRCIGTIPTCEMCMIRGYGPDRCGAIVMDEKGSRARILVSRDQA